MKRTSNVVVSLLILIALSCGPQRKSSEKESAVQLPQLTGAEKTQGWKLLFDGKSMEGWKIFNDYKNNSWEVQAGTLHCKAPNESAEGEDNERSDIMTKDMYTDFELSVEWKVTPEANSGIMFRVTEDFPQAYHSGPEFQIIDDIGYPGKLEVVHQSGANYDLHVAQNKVLKPVGQWNTTRIKVQDNAVEHWLNGTQVVAYTLKSPEWQAMVEQSKWNEHTGYGQSPTGHIVFQDHGGEVWFRNIKIRVL